MRPILPFLAVMAMSACADPTLVSRASGEFTPGLTAPADAAPNTCWDMTETPAVVQTETEDILVQPAKISSTGTVQSPPIYRSETRQVIVQERKASWFQIVCASDLDAEFVTSVQRALQIRGFYSGPETGLIDAPTRGALRRYQAQEQIDLPDTSQLSVEAAKRMGLWAIERPT